MNPAGHLISGVTTGSQNHLIVGIGAAGIEAALEIKRRDPAAQVVILHREPLAQGHIFRPALKEYLAGTLDFADLTVYPGGVLEGQGIRFIQGEAWAVDTETKELRFREFQEEGQVEATFHYHKLLLTTGAIPRLPPYLQGKGFSNVYAFRSLQDAVALKGRLEQEANARVLVIGGGILGVEAAELLATAGRRVTLLSRSSNLVFRGIPEPVKEKLVALFRKRGVQVLRGVSVTDTRVEGNRLTGLELEGGNVVEFDLVVAATGVSLDTTLPASAGLTIGNGIEVDEYMRSSDPNIYAAGDCVFMPWSKRSTLPIWGPARAMGKVAGANMLGEKERFKPWPSYYHSHLFGKPLGFFGDYDAPEEGHTRLVKETGDHYRELVLRDGKLVGASFFGKRPWPAPFIHLMTTKKTPPGGFEALLEEDYDFEGLWYL